MSYMPLQSNDLSYLAGLDQAAFEKERGRLITDMLAAIPEQNRAGCIQLQQELTEHRAIHTASEHLAYLAWRLSENLQNLSDAFGAVAHTSVSCPALKDVKHR